MNTEEMLKAQAEKAYYSNLQGQGQCGPAPAETGYCVGEQNAHDRCKSAAIPISEELRHRRRRNFQDTERLNRALEILTAHPEFEDFLWLIRSGLV